MVNTTSVRDDVESEAVTGVHRIMRTQYERLMNRVVELERAQDARLAPARHGRGKPIAQRVRASEIGKGVEIIGSLGFPLGEILTVQGQWSNRDASGRRLTIKETWLMFLVTSVNGKRLEKPVDFRGFLVSAIADGDMEDLRPTRGDVWEMRGIEIGTYHGVPPEVIGELYPSPYEMKPAMLANFGFGLYTELRYFSRRIIQRGTGEREPETESPVTKAIGEL
jgi:hypothetical protein